MRNKRKNLKTSGVGCPKAVVPTTKPCFETDKCNALYQGSAWWGQDNGSLGKTHISAIGSTCYCFKISHTLSKYGI